MSISDTGERLFPGIENKTTVEHLHRYAFALGFTSNKVVLDIASGEGYGSDLLSKNAQFVYGVDISSEAIQHSKEKYNISNIKFIEGSAFAIPLEDHSIDVIVSFETIEHHDKHDKMMLECKRVLKNDGILIISTPDKFFYNDKPNYKNPFHLKELYKEEFINLISKYFKNIKCYKQGIVKGSIIYADDNEVSDTISFITGNFNGFQNNMDIVCPVYNLIIACDAIFETPSNSFFENSGVDSDLLQKIQTARDHVQKVYNSNSYKIGQALLKPLILLRKIFSL